jgi:hypothetical protein
MDTVIASFIKSTQKGFLKSGTKRPTTTARENNTKKHNSLKFIKINQNVGRALIKKSAKSALKKKKKIKHCDFKEEV